jgi:predicted dehydrogenase
MTIAPTTAPLRVGVCGSGITVFHIAGYQKIPGVEVVAIAGPDVERCRAVAAQYGILQVFADYRDMLALGLDAVSIGVPNTFHAQMAIDTLAAGCHVLCEKPLAINATQAERIVAAARHSDKILMVAFNRRYIPNAIVLKQLIDEGVLGPIYYAKAGWTRRSGIPGLGGWFTTRALAGGGPLIDLGVHMLDLALYMMGYPQPVTVSGATYAEFGPRGKGAMAYGTRPADPARAIFDVEDFATGFIRFENGATLVLEASWAGYQPLGDDIYLQLYGRAGGARLAMPNVREEHALHVTTEMGGTLVDVVPAVPQEKGINEYDREIAAFVQSIRTGVPPPATAEQGLTVMRIIDALYRSAATGQEVRVQ